MGIRRPGLLTDHTGTLSTMRVMSFIALFMALGLTISALITRQPIQIDVLIVWITAAFAPKTIQKFAESKGQTKADLNETASEQS